MNNKILVPIDFEEQSIQNLKWAKYYAEVINSPIILCHIIEENSFLKKLFKQENFEKKVIDEALENLKNIASEHFDKRDQFVYTVVKGKPYEEIEDLADEFEPQMILLGRNENSTGKYLLGSNTLHIINETDFPVVTIFGNSNPANVKNQILLPLDLTKEIAEQTTVAIEFAKLFKSSIKAITVNNKQSVAHDAMIKVKMNQIKEFFAENNIECETQIIDDQKTSPATIIQNIANETNPILVIIMLREESNFRNFFIGSVAKDIIENCNSPVLSVKPWDKTNELNPVFKVVFNPLNIF